MPTPACLKLMRQFVEMERNGDKAAAVNLAQLMTEPTAWQRLSIYRYASMLSATTTALVNVATGLGQIGLEGFVYKPVGIAADKIASAAMGIPSNRSFGEVGAYLGGLAGKDTEVYRDAGQAIGTGLHVGLLAGFKQAWGTLLGGISPDELLRSKLDGGAGSGRGVGFGGRFLGGGGSINREIDKLVRSGGNRDLIAGIDTADLQKHFLEVAEAEFPKLHDEAKRLARAGNGTVNEHLSTLFENQLVDGIQAGSTKGLSGNLFSSYVSRNVRQDQFKPLLDKAESNMERSFGLGNVLDSAIEMPLRVMVATDQIIRSSATSAALYSEIVRRIKAGDIKPEAGESLAATINRIVLELPGSSGLVGKGGERVSRSEALQQVADGRYARLPDETDDALVSRVIGLQKANISDLLEYAQRDAARIVFQEARRGSGALTQGFRGAPTPLKQLLELIVPFIRTPYNIAAQGLEMTPWGLIKTMDDYRGAYKATKLGDMGAASRLSAEGSDKLARVMFGTSVMATMSALSGMGFVTGARPRNAGDVNVMPQGWMPFSFRVPDGHGGAKYVSWQNLGPVAFPMAAAALYNDIWRDMTSEERAAPDAFMKSAVAGVVGVGKFMGDQTFLQGLNSLMKVIDNPDARLENMVEGLSTQFFPYSGLAKQIEQAIGIAPRDPHGALEALLAVNPLTAESIPARHNALGNEVPTDYSVGDLPNAVGRFVSPVRMTAERDEPFLGEMRRLDMGLGSPSRTLSLDGESHKLTDGEFDAYKVQSGKAATVALNTLMDADWYKSASDTDKKQLIDQVLLRSRKLARENLFKRSGPAGPLKGVADQQVVNNWAAEYVSALGEYQQYKKLQLPMPEAELTAASRFVSAYEDTQRTLGSIADGDTKRSVALNVARGADPEGYMAYFKRQTLQQSAIGPLMEKQRTLFWSTHPLVQKYFSQSALKDD